MVNEQERLLLRAEMTVGGETHVTHTLEVSPTALKIVSPVGVPVGAEIHVALSFPGLVERLELTGRVKALHAPDGHGRPSSLTCEIVNASEEVRAKLGTLGEKGRDPSRGPYRCLLVEDNGFIRDLFQYGVGKYGAVRKRGVSMDIAEDAEQAWRMLEAGDLYDMAIIDHYLPTQTGAELISRIRGAERTAKMSVVAISVGGSEVREATMTAGADMFLDKPIVMRDLFETLDKLAVVAHR
jgi:CheY-like chemotaxis protein